MTSLTYPSGQFPGPPTVTVQVPDAWEPVRAPGTMLAARLPRAGAFAPNVVVNIESVPPGFDVQAPLQRVGEIARSRGGDASDAYAAVLGDLEFVGCDSTWPDADVETVLQANLFHVVPHPAGDGPGWLVQLTGAVGGPSAEADYDLIREVLVTVRVTPWSGEVVPG